MIMHYHERLLRDAGYKTKTLTPFHFQAIKPGVNVIVNIWPTAQKILKQYEPGPAAYYTNVVEAMAAQFAKPTMPVLSFDQQAALDWLYEWRKEPLGCVELYLSLI